MIKRFSVLGAAVLGRWFGVLGSSAHAQQPQQAARTRTATYELTGGGTIEGVVFGLTGP